MIIFGTNWIYVIKSLACFFFAGTKVVIKLNQPVAGTKSALFHEDSSQSIPFKDLTNSLVCKDLSGYSTKSLILDPRYDVVPWLVIKITDSLDNTQNLTFQNQQTEPWNLYSQTNKNEFSDTETMKNRKSYFCTYRKKRRLRLSLQSPLVEGEEAMASKLPAAIDSYNRLNSPAYSKFPLPIPVKRPVSESFLNLPIKKPVTPPSLSNLMALISNNPLLPTEKPLPNTLLETILNKNDSDRYLSLNKPIPNVLIHSLPTGNEPGWKPVPIPPPPLPHSSNANNLPLLPNENPVPPTYLQSLINKVNSNKLPSTTTEKDPYSNLPGQAVWKPILPSFAPVPAEYNSSKPTGGMTNSTLMQKIDNNTSEGTPFANVTLLSQVINVFRPIYTTNQTATTLNIPSSTTVYYPTESHTEISFTTTSFYSIENQTNKDTTVSTDPSALSFPEIPDKPNAETISQAFFENTTESAL